MRVLGIETSCDETAVAVYDTDQGLMGHMLYSQVDLHTEYGGVVPELASRDHIRKLTPLIHGVLQQTQTALRELDGIAYTAGPGLVGALMVGASVAVGLACGLGKPSLGVHHMEGHLLAALLEENPPDFPFVALLVSGGHTQLIYAKEFGHYTLLGESIDDAVGEAFDKTAKMLGLGYPGGARLAALAQTGQPRQYVFTRPMTDRPGLMFSFSGLKTQVLTTWQKSSQTEKQRADIACAFEEAVVDTLVIKCQRALMATDCTRLVVAGGVGANLKLREKLRSQLTQTTVYFPCPEFCTDNGAMIAFAGWQRLRRGEQSNQITLRPRWQLTELTHKETV